MADSTPNVQVGLAPRAEGAQGTGLRVSKESAQIVANVGGDYGEAASRGQIFTGQTLVAGTTVVAANVTPIGAAAASIFTLYNPIGSGKNLELLKTVLMPISGTPGVGTFVYNVGSNQTITAAQNNQGVAAAVPVPNLIGGSASVAKVFTQTALTGSTAQTMHRPICAFFGGAIAATSPVYFMDEANGDIVVPPGGVLSIAAGLVGTTFVVAAFMTWREVAIP